MKKIVCRPHSHPHEEINVWKKCAPFFQNPRGVLLHRVYTAFTFFKDDGSIQHSHVTYWCRNGTNLHDRRDNEAFTDAPREDQILCVHCEGRATSAGELSADELAGYHVHIGTAKAVRVCCRDEKACTK